MKRRQSNGQFICNTGENAGFVFQILNCGGETDENGNVDIEMVLQKYIPVALAGRVHVKYYGMAKAGMKVVPSEIPGVGRAFADGDKEENVMGRIVEGDTFQNVRKVKVMVRRQ